MMGYESNKSNNNIMIKSFIPNGLYNKFLSGLHKIKSFNALYYTQSIS